VRHLRPDLGKFDAGYVAHPSFVEEDELRDMKGPLSIAAAETDSIFPAEKRHRTEEVLKEMVAQGGEGYQIKCVLSFPCFYLFSTSFIIAFLSITSYLPLLPFSLSNFRFTSSPSLPCYDRDPCVSTHTQLLLPLIPICWYQCPSTKN
jgi:hypothetical protein